MSAIVNFNQNEGLFVIASVLLHRKSSSSLNFPVIPTFRDIANLLECMAMFHFIKRLSVFRIATEPCADRFLYCQLGVFIGTMSFIAIRNRQTTLAGMSGLPVFRDCELSLRFYS